MLPEEFVRFSKRFEVGFLVWIRDERPTMKRCDFHISSEKIQVMPREYDPLRLPPLGSKVTLVFANPLYTEKCEMGIVKGTLQGAITNLEIDPRDITWTSSFDVNRYPKRIVQRWQR